MPKITKQKLNYSIDFRTRTRSGAWGNWHGKAQGEWQGIDHLRNQIKMLIRASTYDIEIEVIKDGKLIDVNGDETDRYILFQKR